MNDLHLLSRVPSRKRLVIGCIVVGTLVRLMLAAISIGSNDAVNWYRFAVETRVQGIIPAYASDSDLNHPLLPMVWAQLAAAIGGENWFTFVFKLPFIGADAISAWLAAVVAERMRGSRAGVAAAAAMAFSPIAILISGYHGNDDCGYAMLVLLSASVLMQGRFLAGGLALGAAINIKLVPVMLVPAALASCRTARDAWRLLIGLFICVLPFVPLLLHPQVIQSNMLKYTGWPDRWSVIGFCLELKERPQSAALGQRLEDIYLPLGRILIIIGILTIAVLAWRTRRWSVPQHYLIACCVFLIFAPGFGLQYLVLPLPLMAALNRNVAWSYSIAAGLFALTAYWFFLQPGFPLMSGFFDTLPHAAAVFGWLTFGRLGQLLFQLLFMPRPEDA